MKKKQIASHVFWVGSIDWQRRLFDGMLPIPEGTTYNSYLIYGSEKTALLDTVEEPFWPELLSKLADVKKIDYIISHHAEQDHSGMILEVLQKYPDAKVVCTPKAVSLLTELIGIPENVFLPVEDLGEISLGDKTLQFLHTPWVHWPETMMTYIKEDKLLFSCDFFGAHVASSELFSRKFDFLGNDAYKRYFAGIMMPFRPIISKNLEKLANIDVHMIAPSHGFVHDEPKGVQAAYAKWVSDTPENKVLIPYVTMHGSTEKMVVHLVDALMDRSIQVVPLDLTAADMGQVAKELVDAATLIVGVPTVLAGPHPAVASGVFLANALRPTTKYAAIIGSYGWAGKTEETLVGMMKNFKAELLPSVLWKGAPTQETYTLLDQLADTILEKHKALGIL